MLYQFIYTEHEEFGTNGWCPVWIPNTDPLGGMAIPHDVMEHCPGDDGSTAHELMALGACLLVRGNGGYFQAKGRYNPTYANQVGADVCDLVLKALNGIDAWPVSGPPTVTIKEYDEGLFAAIQAGFKTAREENSDTDDDDSKAELYRLTNSASAKIALAWMRKGYRRAVRRYRDSNSAELTRCFLGIEAEVDKVTKWAELGQRLNVRFQAKGLEWKVWLEEEEGED